MNPNPLPSSPPKKLSAWDVRALALPEPAAWARTSRCTSRAPGSAT